jgi:hypothetical protein
LGALAPRCQQEPADIRGYGDSDPLLAAFLSDRFGNPSVAGITRDHIETFIAATPER